MVHNVIEVQPPSVRYILAVDGTLHAQEEIVKAISTTLTTGKIKRIPKEEATLDKNLCQQDYDLLTVNLRMTPGHIKDMFNVKWKCENGIVENIGLIVQEYKNTRNLTPIKIAIHGPPAVGKSTIAKKLAEHFKIHHVHAKSVIDEAMQRMERSVARVDATEGEDEDDDAAERAQEDQTTLEAVKEQQSTNERGRISDDFVIKFFRDKLLSKPCQNQGFILDGFPKNREQAEGLFARDDEAEEEDAKEYNRLIMPDLVISLEASDDFLRERVINLPERLVYDTNLTEEAFSRRIETFRTNNEPEETVLNYFDEFQVPIEKIDVCEDKSEKYVETSTSLMKKIGEPRNYGPTPEEIAYKKQCEEDEKRIKEEQAKKELEANEARENEIRRQRQETYVSLIMKLFFVVVEYPCQLFQAAKLEQIRRDQLEQLEKQSLPLRHYLMKNVMPTLTQAMVEAVKHRPDDPVDFVAEYLFKNNPQVD